MAFHPECHLDVLSIMRLSKSQHTNTVTCNTAVHQTNFQTDGVHTAHILVGCLFYTQLLHPGQGPTELFWVLINQITWKVGIWLHTAIVKYPELYDFMDQD